MNKKGKIKCSMFKSKKKKKRIIFMRKKKIPWLFIFSFFWFLTAADWLPQRLRFRK